MLLEKPPRGSRNPGELDLAHRKSNLPLSAAFLAIPGRASALPGFDVRGRRRVCRKISEATHARMSPAQRALRVLRQRSSQLRGRCGNDLSKDHAAWLRGQPDPRRDPTVGRERGLELLLIGLDGVGPGGL